MKNETQFTYSNQVFINNLSISAKVFVSDEIVSIVSYTF